MARSPQESKLASMGPQLLLTTLLSLAALVAILFVGGRWLAARGLGLTRRGKHVEVVERVPLRVGVTRHNAAYLQTKVAKSGHLP